MTNKNQEARPTLTHRDLCIIAAKYIRSKNGQIGQRYSICELERVGECPDAFGFGGSTVMIEAKASRSDFLSDKKKYWRMYPDYGVGEFRYYICPEGLIKETELPENWGLIYINEKKKPQMVVKAKRQKSNKSEEIEIICAILRREGIKEQTFSYKNYKNDSDEVMDNEQ